MTIDDKFNENMSKWKEHCIQNRYSSNTNKYLDCEGYQNLIAMGREILPQIHQEIESGKAFEFPSLLIFHLVRGIVGQEFEMPEELNGKMSKRWDYTKDWLKNNI